MCETWMDHEFGESKLVRSGKDPANGAYQVFVRTCGRCTKRSLETRWIGAERARVHEIEMQMQETTA